MSMAKKRFRAKKVYPGQLRAYWGKLPHDAPDIVFQWGEGCSRRDGAFLSYHFSSQRMRLPRGDEPGRTQFDPSFLDALTARGFDITTLEFSVHRLPQHLQTTGSGSGK
jgi:hypothetical protein